LLLPTEHKSVAQFLGPCSIHRKNIRMFLRLSPPTKHKTKVACEFIQRSAGVSDTALINVEDKMVRGRIESVHEKQLSIVNEYMFNSNVLSDESSDEESEIKFSEDILESFDKAGSYQMENFRRLWDDDFDNVEDSLTSLSPNNIGLIINLVKKEFYNSLFTIKTTPASTLL
ncbi:10830_t:CDS:2, partial [Funneliformis geosporum]